MATTTTTLAEAILRLLVPAQRGQTEDCPLPVKAVPGVTTLLDVALYQANEGQLTATIVSGHALLATWLDVKKQAQTILQLLKNDAKASGDDAFVESLARQGLESAMDAIERLQTDRLAAAANLTDPYDSTAAAAASGSGGNHYYYHGNPSVLSGIGAQSVSDGVLNSKEETGRRRPLQRHKDCWESPRLHCPDYIWADDAYSACQRWIKGLDKHPLVEKSRNSSDGLGLDTMLTAASNKKSSSSSHHHHPSDQAAILPPETERQLRILVQLIEDDLPMRLYQFKQALDTDAVVTKRLYLVKCEYRAPLRAFWEAHQSLLRAPPLEIVNNYLEDSSWTKVKIDRKSKLRNSACVDGGQRNTSETAAESQEDLKKKLQALLQTPALTELLTLEMEAEKMEVALGEALFPFTELARIVDHKRAHLNVVSGVLEATDFPALQETIRRLKFILCRKAGAESSSGIRPILLDLQMIPRDDEPGTCTALGWLTSSAATVSPFSKSSRKDASLEDRIDCFLSQLSTLSVMVKTKNAFATISSGWASGSVDVDFNAPIVKGCTDEFDPELMKCQFLDWFAIVKRQHALQNESSQDGGGQGLAEEIRLAELKMSIASANHQSLQLVKERLAGIHEDRTQRLEICKEMVEEVCLREMNLFVSLSGPEPSQTLELKGTSAKGFLGHPLERAGESMPVG